MILTESDVCLSGRAERKHLARRRLEFFSLLLSSVILCHPHSLVSSVRNVCVLPSGVTRCPQSPGDSGICVLKGEKKEMAFISFVFKWNSPDFSLLSDTLINSSMLSLYIRARVTGPRLCKPISSCCHGSAFLAPLVSRAWPITRSNAHQLPVPSVRAVKELRWSVSLWFWSACSL